MEEIAERVSTLKPPVTDLTFPQGKQNRRKLLRAWLEIGSWLTDFKRIHGDFIPHHHVYVVNAVIATYFKDAVKETRPHVQLNSAREMYQIAIGAHPGQSQHIRSHLYVVFQCLIIFTPQFLAEVSPTRCWISCYH